MKYLLICLSLAVGALAYKDNMISSNRVAKERSLTTSCDECQNLVHKFHDALNDPKKLDELKMLLRVLCHETPYVDECRVFVNNLDQIIKKLEPWLKDAKAVCSRMHMCANQRINTFHKIGMIYAERYMDPVQGYKDLMCDECQFIAAELKKEIDDKKVQDGLRDFLRRVCSRLGQGRGMCDMLSEQFLPEFFQEMDAVLSHPKQTCAKIGFCQAVIGTGAAPKFGRYMNFLASL